MKILHVIGDLAPESGGPTQVCLDVSTMMAKRGHEVRVITTDSGLPSEALDHAERFPPVPNLTVETYPRNWPRFFGTSWSLSKRLATAIAETDVVHLHSLYRFHDVVTGAFCRRYGKPYIVQPHGTLDPYHYRRHRWRKILIEAAFQNRVQRRARGLLYTTNEEKELATPVACNDHDWVAALGIDAPYFTNLPSRNVLRERYPQIGDRQVVLFFGRLNFKKGLDTTIKTFAAVARDHDDIFLLVVGPDGGLREAAEGWAADAGIADRTLFTGMLLGEDKRMILAGSDVFLLPSLSENFGISVIEAAICGVPVVVSDRVNIWRDFSNAGAGLVGPPTVETFIKHLRFLIENPAEAAALGRRGADLVRKRFTWDALGEHYELMYRQVAGLP